MDSVTMEARDNVVGLNTQLAWSGGLAEEAFCFRNFRLLPGARILLRDGQPVEIGSRAFDLLHLLLMSQGLVVEHDAIIRHVWPTTTVEECNLRSQVLRVRQALGAHRDLLKTVPGRGYLLVADPETAVARRERPAGDTFLAIEPSSPDTSEAEILRALLRSVLDELWEMTRYNTSERNAFAQPNRAHSCVVAADGRRHR